jgi:HD superfamily phosphohydrolase
MSESRSVRDPIHGFIRLTGEEADIVATPVFQRLRGIRQLAFANLVYPGALHTRFEHTLGVFHVTSLMAKVCKLDDEHARLVRLAALVHDLGHGPFSHVSEGALDIFADRAKLAGRLNAAKPEKIHELVTQDLLRTDSGLIHVLGKRTLTQVESLLAQGYDEPVLRSIISGPLDADKQDYLQRDTYFCGVKYGVFDLQQLHRELEVVEDPVDGRKVLMVSSDGVHALEQFVLAKYYLTAQVYSHRVRLITDQMVVRAITLGIEEDKIETLRSLYSYDGEESFVANFIGWDDARFLLAFGDATLSGSYCQDLVRRLSERRLLKEVFQDRVSHLPESCRERITKISQTTNRSARRELECRIADVIQKAGVPLDCKLKDPANLVVAHSFSLKSARAQSRNDEGSIMIHTVPDPTPFEEESDLFRSINEKMNDPHFAVYAPVVYHSPGERRELHNKIKEPIVRCLEGFGNGE